MEAVLLLSYCQVSHGKWAMTFLPKAQAARTSGYIDCTSQLSHWRHPKGIHGTSAAHRLKSSVLLS